MRESLLEYLCCPACEGGDLKVEAEDAEAGDIESGALECRACGQRYPVIGGIPRMLPESAAYFEWERGEKQGVAALEGGARDLELTVKRYSDYQGKVYAPLADRLDNKKILEARTGLSLADFEGRVCLDAGCGVGRLTRTMAAAPARLVVGFDAGFSVDAAREKSEAFENIEWVQGDILRPPFREGCFDRVITIGVLHHTARPDRGFRLLSGKVAEGGSLSVYLYTHGHLRWDRLASIKPVIGRLRYVLFTEPFRRFVVRFPMRVRHGWCRLLWMRRRLIEWVRRGGAPGRAMAKLLEFLTPPDIYKPRESAESNIARSFDLYSTPYNFSHEFGEVLDWFEKFPKYREVKVTPYRLSMTGWIGKPRGEDEELLVRYRAQKSMEDIESAGVEREKDVSGSGRG